MSYHRYWKIERNEAPWNKIPDTPEAIAEAITKGAMFVTCLALDGDPDGDPPPNRRGDFCLDLDAENPGKAFAEARQIIAHLEEAYGVTPYQIRIYISGKKGIHLVIPCETLGIMPGPYLHLEYRRLAAKLKSDLGLETLDMSLYAGGKGKMFRLPNVRRDNGRYKVPVMPSELRGLNDEELVRLTENPRHLDPDEEPEEPTLADALHDLFNQFRQVTQKEMAAAKEHRPLDPEALEALKHQMPPCIPPLLRLKEKPLRGNFNQIVMNLAIYLSVAGYDEASAWDVVGGFVHAYQSGTYKTSSDREKHWRYLFTYLQDNSSYIFSCGAIKSLGLPGNVFECRQCHVNPDRAPTRAEFEQIIDDTSDIDDLLKVVLRQIVQARLSSAETNILLKKIAKKAGCSLKNLQTDARRFEASQDELQLQHAWSCIRQIGQNNIITDQSGTYIWGNHGVWEKTDNRSLKKICHIVMPIEEVSKSEVESVLDLIKTETFRPDHRWDPDCQSINALNGEIHFDGDKWKLIPHCREHFRTTQIPVEFDPQAQCPRFDQFVVEVVYEKGLEEKMKTFLIHEMLGYAMLASAKYEKFFLLIGDGANGKSVLLSVLIELVGVQNITSVQPSQFDNSFYRAHLHRKLANIVTELKVGVPVADDWLKKIASGELTSADHKFKPPFEFYPFSTCIFAANHLPETRDCSPAMFRRAVMLDFTRVFREDEQDVNLKDKLKAEMSGILNRALDGLARVIKRGRFTEPTTSAKLKRRWQHEADHVAEFVDEKCKKYPDSWIGSTDLYEAYKSWVEFQCITRKLSQKKFSIRLKALGVQKVDRGISKGFQIELRTDLPPMR